MAKFKVLNEAGEEQEIEAFTAEEMQAKIDDVTGGLKSKVDELLGESKTAKQKAKELEELQTKAEEDRLKEKQEFKTLFEREQEAKRGLQEQYESFKGKVQTKDIAIAVSDLAVNNAADADRAKVLKQLIEVNNAKFGEDGVYYEVGGVTVDSETLIGHYAKEYPFLIKGNQSAGGGAPGGNGGAERKNPKDMNSAERIAFKNADPEGFKKAFNP